MFGSIFKSATPRSGGGASRAAKRPGAGGAGGRGRGRNGQSSGASAGAGASEADPARGKKGRGRGRGSGRAQEEAEADFVEEQAPEELRQPGPQACAGKSKQARRRAQQREERAAAAAAAAPASVGDSAEAAAAAAGAKAGRAPVQAAEKAAREAPPGTQSCAGKSKAARKRAARREAAAAAAAGASPPSAATGASSAVAKRAAARAVPDEDESDGGNEEEAAAPLGGTQEAGAKLSKQARKRARRREAAAAAAKGAAKPVAGEPARKKQRPAEAEKTGGGPAVEPTLLSSVQGTALSKAAEKLKGSRFRWLNEMLYSSTGDDAKKAFDDDPSLAYAYHEGFRVQAAKWPRNPLDDVIAWIRKEVRKGSTIGDFGCGDARLSLELNKAFTVHSFDLIAINDRITPCNLAAVPLESCALDVAVFCLALMGTDWPAFVAEAWRCLRPGGLLHIVEVESRFEDVEAVVRTIEQLGFRKTRLHPGNFFIELRFTRTEGLPGAASTARKHDRSRGGGAKASSAGSASAAGPAAPAAGLGRCIYRRR